jgi:hypothetical protein
LSNKFYLLFPDFQLVVDVGYIQIIIPPVSEPFWIVLAMVSLGILAPLAF